MDRHSQITVRANRYSVPARLIGRRVRVMLHACELIVYDGREGVARHERLPARRQAAWSWTTTWKSSSASPAPCPEPPCWSRRGRRASSPPCTTSGGRRAEPTPSPWRPAISLMP
ncbi:Mu transposase domain-containing protein [Sphaerisporangium fuscum]|uniref:Mu transposase domain-containing protein n=1 Tax=Sphaerisporangium fuscum TaxID=2835868 RepID=UPI00355868D8